MLSLFFSCGKKEKNDENQNLTYEDTLVSESDTSDLPFITEEENNDTVKIVSEDTTGKLKPVKSPVKVSPTQKIYVIVGSFKNYANAEKLVNQLKSKGFNPQILPKYGEFNRVAVAGYDTEKEAREALKKFRQTFHNRKIWLLLR